MPNKKEQLFWKDESTRQNFKFPEEFKDMIKKYYANHEHLVNAAELDNAYLVGRILGEGGEVPIETTILFYWWTSLTKDIDFFTSDKVKTH